MELHELAISYRAYDKLGNCIPPITTIDELCDRSSADLLKLRNFGAKSLAEIVDALNKIGRQLADMQSIPPFLTAMTEAELRQAHDRAKQQVAAIVQIMRYRKISIRPRRSQSPRQSTFETIV